MFSTTHSGKSGKKTGEKEKQAVKVKKIDFKLDTEEFPALGGGPAPLPKSPTVKTVVKTAVEKPVTPPPVKTAASFLFSNVAKSVAQVKSQKSIAVNIVQNKQQQATATKTGSKQTGAKQAEPPTVSHKPRESNQKGRVNSVSTSSGSRPSSALRVTKKNHK